MRLDQEGKYDVTVTNAYMTESQGGTPGIVFEFNCEEGSIDCTRWVTPKTAERLWGDLETLGFTKKHAEDMDNLDRLGEIVNGHMCRIVTKFESYNGEETLKVQWINPIGGPRSTAVETKQNIHAVLSGNSITAPALRSAPRSARPQSEPPPNSPTDESVPF